MQNLSQTSIMDSTNIAREFISKYFPDCDGAMIVHQADTTTNAEIIVFYHNINTHYQKSFNFRGSSMDVKVYRTSNCSFLAAGDQSRHTDALASLLSQGTILKDYNHEVETIMTEARLILEKKVSKNIPIYKRIESNLFSLVCL